MKNKPITLIIALTAVLLLSILKILTVAPTVERTFPQHATDRVYLPPHDDKEEFRHERFAADGFTRIDAERQYRDGVTEKVTFREDGTISGYTRHYPGPDGTRPLRSRAEIDRAGIFFVSHEVYRADGTLERTGKLLGDGRYESVFYWSDGTTVSRQRFFSRDKQFISENIYGPTGIHLLTRHQQGSNIATSSYHANGKLASTILKTMYGVEGKVFAEDGTTLLSEFEKSPWSESEKHYSAGGKLVLYRTATSMTGGSDVFVLDDNGTTLFRQVWRNARRTPDGPIEAILSRVHEMKGLQVHRVIELDKTGAVTSVTYPRPEGGRVVNEMNDGKVVRRVTFDKSNKEVESVFTNEHESIDQARLREIPRTSRPELVEDKSAPPMVYDYP